MSGCQNPVLRSAASPCSVTLLREVDWNGSSTRLDFFASVDACVFLCGRALPALGSGLPLSVTLVESVSSWRIRAIRGSARGSGLGSGEFESNWRSRAVLSPSFLRFSGLFIFRRGSFFCFAPFGDAVDAVLKKPPGRRPGASSFRWTVDALSRSSRERSDPLRGNEEGE